MVQLNPFPVFGAKKYQYHLTEIFQRNLLQALFPFPAPPPEHLRELACRPNIGTLNVLELFWTL